MLLRCSSEPRANAFLQMIAEANMVPTFMENLFFQISLAKRTQHNHKQLVMFCQITGVCDCIPASCSKLFPFVPFAPFPPLTSIQKPVSGTHVRIESILTKTHSGSQTRLNMTLSFQSPSASYFVFMFLHDFMICLSISFCIFYFTISMIFYVFFSHAVPFFCLVMSAT